jgi:hypothetical protein
MAAQPKSPWTPGRIIGLIFTGIAGLVGLGLLLAGIAVMVAYGTMREDGFFTSDKKQLESATYAIVTEDIDLDIDEADWPPDEILGDVRLRVESEQPVFVGIGEDADVDRYLAGVEHDELTDFDGDDAELDLHQGRRPRTPPGEQDFWVAEAEGPGEQSLVWDAEFGRWTAVLMNADGTRGVTVDADAGIKLGWALWAGLGLLVVGLLMTVGAVIVTLLIVRGVERANAAPPAVDDGPAA